MMWCFPVNSFNFKLTFVETTFIHRMYKVKIIKSIFIKLCHWLTRTYNTKLHLFSLKTFWYKPKILNLPYFIDLPIMKLLYTWREEFRNWFVNYYIVYPHAFHSFFSRFRSLESINVTVIQIATDRFGNIIDFFPNGWKMV